MKCSLAMSTAPIYEYQSARTFLLDQISEKRKSIARFSLRSWAKEIGFKQHVSLVMVLKGKRNISLKMVPFLSKGLRLSTPETQYLQGLVLLDNTKNEEEARVLKPWLASMNPGEGYLVKEINEQKVFSEWIHYAILVEAFSKRGLPDLDSVIKKFSKQVPSSEIYAAFERLKKLELLVWDESNQRWKSQFSRVTTRDDVPNPAVRQYHREMSQKAAQALESQSVHEREFHSFSMTLSPETLPSLKQLMRKFRSDVETLLRNSSPGNETYQMNLHCFRLHELLPESAHSNSSKTKSRKTK